MSMNQHQTRSQNRRHDEIVEEEMDDINAEIHVTSVWDEHPHGDEVEYYHHDEQSTRPQQQEQVDNRNNKGRTNQHHFDPDRIIKKRQGIEVKLRDQQKIPPI